jgi:hypothetical protein
MSREARTAWHWQLAFHDVPADLEFIFPDRRRHKRKLVSSISHLLSHFAKPRSMQIVACSQHRIPNLGTFYVATNDDMVLTTPVDSRTFFFSPNGSPRTMNGDTTIESNPRKVNRKMVAKKGGQHPRIKHGLEKLSSFVDARPIKRLHPAHFPRPFHQEFIDHVQSRNSVLFQSPFSKQLRSQEFCRFCAFTKQEICGKQTPLAAL